MDPPASSLCCTPNGVKFLGGLDIAFNWGEQHRRLRKSFLPLFTRQALGMYLKVHDKLIRESIAYWLKVGHIETEIRNPIRDMNVWTSQ